MHAVKGVYGRPAAFSSALILLEIHRNALVLFLHIMLAFLRQPRRLADNQACPAVSRLEARYVFRPARLLHSLFVRFLSASHGAAGC